MGKLVDSGEPWVAGHGGRRPDLEKMADLFSVKLRMNGSRSILNRWPRLEDTPSWGNLSKESLDFFLIEPAVL
jgi:hypothetical protein